MGKDEKVNRFFEAAAELIKDGIDQLKSEDPALHADVAKAVSAGSILSLVVAFDHEKILGTRCLLDMRNGEKVKIFQLVATPIKWN